MQNSHNKLFVLYKQKVRQDIYISKGFTLLELLISVVISSIIAVGVGSVYYGIRSTQNSQNSVSELRDNIFIALDRIESSIKHASFTEYGDQRFNPNESYMNVTSPIASQIGTDPTAHTSNTSTTNGSDTFTLEVSSPDIAGEMIDCTGAAMPINTGSVKKSVYQKFTVANDSLMCSINTRTRDIALGTDTYTGFTTAVKIASGVKNMQVFYAIKNPTDGCGVSASSNAWKTASEVTDFSTVCAINISLLATSQTGQNINVAKETTSLQHFNLLLNNNINDNVAKDITISVGSSLLKNTRIIKKIVFLRNNDKY